MDNVYTIEDLRTTAALTEGQFHLLTYEQRMSSLFASLDECNEYLKVIDVIQKHGKTPEIFTAMESFPRLKQHIEKIAKEQGSTSLEVLVTAKLSIIDQLIEIVRIIAQAIWDMLKFLFARSSRMRNDLDRYLKEFATHRVDAKFGDTVEPGAYDRLDLKKAMDLMGVFKDRIIKVMGRFKESDCLLTSHGEVLELQTIGSDFGFQVVTKPGGTSAVIDSSSLSTTPNFHMRNPDHTGKTIRQLNWDTFVMETTIKDVMHMLDDFDHLKSVQKRVDDTLTYNINKRIVARNSAEYVDASRFIQEILKIYVWHIDKIGNEVLRMCVIAKKNYV